MATRKKKRWRMREEKITPAELGRCLGWKYPQVVRLFDLERKTQVDQLASAFAALGAEMVIGFR